MRGIARHLSIVSCHLRLNGQELHRKPTKLGHTLVVHGGFLKWAIHFKRMFHYKPTILGIPQVKLAPHMVLLYLLLTCCNVKLSILTEPGLPNPK